VTLECVPVHVIERCERSHLRRDGIRPLREQHRQILVSHLPQHALHQVDPANPGESWSSCDRARTRIDLA
jgi:hypothetical protein